MASTNQPIEQAQTRMQRFSLRSALFALLFFSIPLPLFLNDIGWVPAARTAQLSLHMLHLLWVEKAVATTIIITSAFTVQALIYTLLCYGLARLLCRPLFYHPRRIAAVVVVALMWLALALQTPVYHDLFLPESSAASLRNIYD